MNKYLFIFFLLLFGCKNQKQQILISHADYYSDGKLMQRYDYYVGPNGQHILHGKKYMYPNSSLYFGCGEYELYDDGKLVGSGSFDYHYNPLDLKN